MPLFKFEGTGWWTGIEERGLIEAENAEIVQQPIVEVPVPRPALVPKITANTSSPRMMSPGALKNVTMDTETLKVGEFFAKGGKEAPISMSFANEVFVGKNKAKQMRTISFIDAEALVGDFREQPETWIEENVARPLRGRLELAKQVDLTVEAERDAFVSQLRSHAARFGFTKNSIDTLVEKTMETYGGNIRVNVTETGIEIFHSGGRVGQVNCLGTILSLFQRQGTTISALGPFDMLTALKTLQYEDPAFREALFNTKFEDMTKEFMRIPREIGRQLNLFQRIQASRMQDRVGERFLSPVWTEGASHTFSPGYSIEANLFFLKALKDPAINQFAMEQGGWETLLQNLHNDNVDVKVEAYIKNYLQKFDSAGMHRLIRDNPQAVKAWIEYINSERQRLIDGDPIKEDPRMAVALSADKSELSQRLLQDNEFVQKFGVREHELKADRILPAIKSFRGAEFFNEYEAWREALKGIDEPNILKLNEQIEASEKSITKLEKITRNRGTWMKDQIEQHKLQKQAQIVLRVRNAMKSAAVDPTAKFKIATFFMERISGRPEYISMMPFIYEVFDKEIPGLQEAMKNLKESVHSPTAPQSIILGLDKDGATRAFRLKMNVYDKGNGQYYDIIGFEDITESDPGKEAIKRLENPLARREGVPLDKDIMRAQSIGAIEGTGKNLIAEGARIRGENQIVKPVGAAEIDLSHLKDIPSETQAINPDPTPVSATTPPVMSIEGEVPRVEAAPSPGVAHPQSPDPVPAAVTEALQREAKAEAEMKEGPFRDLLGKGALNKLGTLAILGMIGYGVYQTFSKEKGYNQVDYTDYTPDDNDMWTGSNNAEYQERLRLEKEIRYNNTIASSQTLKYNKYRRRSRHSSAGGY